jgi:decaprenylphospho-beta-D-erythro-pentofuranosid-2-ulose 2-reductase
MSIIMRSSTPHTIRMQRIVVLGATSAVALEFQRQLARQRRELLLVARTPERLSALQSDLLARGAKNVLTAAADLARIQHHAGIFDFVRHSFPNFDTVLLAYGTMEDRKHADDSVDVLLDELNVNFVSAAALLTLFAADLEQRRTGCLAAITSAAGDCGWHSNYVHGSAKGGLALFLQGLRRRLHPAGVRVITIKPGPVLTPMTEHMPNSAGFAQPERVARDMIRALERRSPDVLYTPWFWRPIMTAVRNIPESFLKRRTR